MLQIQFLHCIEQSPTGGENVMSDFIRAALVLRERNPEYYHTLTTCLIEQEDLIIQPDVNCYLAGAYTTIK